MPWGVSIRRWLIVAAVLGSCVARAQLDGTVISLEHAFDTRPGIGYLPALLDALVVPV